ncbi:MAG: ROK family transcriptional regulator [Propionibacteriaceae bacterium]|jgi:predicted NBD/HSP70 family sugar kinase|nr:ROK family transcriptional regulator [Propionibacteriaceae bacterium]
MADTATPFGSQTSLREANRARILDMVKKFGAITQVELADATRLSPGTVSVIVKELLEAGIVNTAPTSRSGRRAVQVTLARRLGLVAGIHIGRRDLKLALANPSGEILVRQHLPLAKEHRADTGLDRVSLLISDMLDHIGATHEELLGAGVALDAPVDSHTGMVCSPGLMRGWDQVPIAESLTKRVGCPVVVDNGVNLGALAECRLGAGVGANPVVYLSTSYGIGAGIVLDDVVFRGFSGTAGEIGHVSIDPDGPICYCGNRGCLEVVAGASAMLEALRLTHGNLSLPDLIEQALAGDVASRRVIEDAARNIGVALAALCNIIDPQRIVVGGELARVGDLFLAPLRSVTSRFTLPSSTPTIEIVPSALGQDCELVGAVCHALDSVTLPGNLEGVVFHDVS